MKTYPGRWLMGLVLLFGLAATCTPAKAQANNHHHHHHHRHHRRRTNRH